MAENSGVTKKSSGWVEQAIKTVSACDKFMNCGYVRNQLEMEYKEDCKRAMQTPVERLFQKLDKRVEVEVYRQFLFEESNSLEPSFEEQQHADGNRLYGVNLQQSFDSHDEPSIASGGTSGPQQMKRITSID